VVGAAQRRDLVAPNKQRPVRILPPGEAHTGPAPPGRPVCAPGAMAFVSQTERPSLGKDLIMTESTWYQHGRRVWFPTRARPALEVLEDRCLLSVNLVEAE